MKVRPPEEELKATKLWQQLDKMNSEYSEAVEKFVTKIAPLLASIKEIFPYYTRHDAHHSYRVILRIEQIVDKRCLESDSEFSFTPDELLLLICSAYAHDLGMAVIPGEETSLIKSLEIEESNWQSNKKLLDHLRQTHSERGGRYVAANNQELGLPQNLIGMLNKLMEAHNLSISDLEKELGKRFAAGSQEIDLKQLACILCIADAMEFSETRVVEGVLDILAEKMEQTDDKELLLSYQHNMQHICISDSVTVGDDGKIIFAGTFNDPDIMSLAHNTIDFIENWVRNYKDIDYRSKLKRLIVRTDSIDRQLTIVGYDFERIGIRIKKENIIDLISSNATWTNDPAIVIRELLQNSVEACRYRQFHSPTYYNPSITVRIDSNERTVEIIDNGCGMSRHIILNNFLTIANSRSSDPSYASSNYSSLARFGIGFWSVFTIADNATILTAPFEYILSQPGLQVVDGVSFNVSIKEFKDFTVFKPEKIAPGTAIKLYLKQGVSIPDLTQKISYHIGCSEIPISIDFNDQIRQIPKRMSLPSFDEAFGTRSIVEQQYNLYEFEYSELTEEIDIQLKMFYTEKDGKYYFTIPETDTSITILQDLSLSMKYRGYGICGFLFNGLPITPILDFNRIGFVSANAINPKGYKFTLNRLGLMNSPEYSIFKSVIKNAIHTCYRNFLTEKQIFTAENVARLNRESRASGGETHGSFTGDSLKTMLENDGDLIAFKLYKIERNKTVHTCSVTYVFYKDLVEKNWTIWSCNPGYHHINFRGFNTTKGFIYDVLKIKADLNDTWYLLESSIEADRIADNAEGGIIDANTKISSNLTPLPLRRFQANDIKPGTAINYVISDNVRGMWAGTIVERDIIGSDFVSLYQHHFVVNTGSQLSSDIKNLLKKEEMYKLTELIKRLSETAQGRVHESVKKYVDEVIAMVTTS
jgi:hypothetical protein